MGSFDLVVRVAVQILAGDLFGLGLISNLKVPRRPG
jgi:hypothetical protein